MHAFNLSFGSLVLQHLWLCGLLISIKMTEQPLGEWQDVKVHVYGGVREGERWEERHGHRHI